MNVIECFYILMIGAVASISSFLARPIGAVGAIALGALAGLCWCMVVRVLVGLALRKRNGKQD
jgi:hypothetical protein